MYTHLRTTDSPGAMFRATPTADHKLFHIPFSTTREEAAEPLSWKKIIAHLFTVTVCKTSADNYELNAVWCNETSSWKTRPFINFQCSISSFPAKAIIGATMFYMQNFTHFSICSTAGSLFFSRNSAGVYEARRLSLWGNGARHGRGTHYSSRSYHPCLAFFLARPLQYQPYAWSK